MAQEGLVLTEAQMMVMEPRKSEAHGKLETEHPGYPGSQDSFNRKWLNNYSNCIPYNLS